MDQNRKKEILDSRVITTNLLYKALSTSNHKVKGIISASAVGYYGQTTTESNFKEEDQPGNDFVATVCKAWEDAVNQVSELRHENGQFKNRDCPYEKRRRS